MTGEQHTERPAFEQKAEFQYTKVPSVDWKTADGSTNDEWKKHKKIEIDPYDKNRTPRDNYTLLISGIVPRPIGFVSTVGKDGKANLAPFSYFNVMGHDPPVFLLGLALDLSSPKDTYKNFGETGELTINIISEWFVEAANYTSTDAPLDVSEWELSGLTPLPSSKVFPPHVAESAFSIEARLLYTHVLRSRSDESKVTGQVCIVEGVQFHMREELINQERNKFDLSKLKPVARCGGITFSRTTSGYEIPRPRFQEEVQTDENVKKVAYGEKN